jgi:hypothetical protein
MQKLKRYLIILYTGIMLITGWGVGVLIFTQLPNNYFPWYPAIPTFFYLLGIIFINILIGSKKDNPRKLTNLYMLLKYSKIALAIIFGGFYLLFVKVHARDFSVIFSGFYLLYLGLETYIFYCTEKEIKKNTVDEKLT